MTSVFGNRALFLLIDSESHGAMYSGMGGIGRRSYLTSGTKETTSTAERY